MLKKKKIILFKKKLFLYSNRFLKEKFLCIFNMLGCLLNCILMSNASIQKEYSR
jgi:hypothetical protein